MGSSKRRKVQFADEEFQYPGTSAEPDDEPLPTMIDITNVNQTYPDSEEMDSTPSEHTIQNCSIEISNSYADSNTSNSTYTSSSFVPSHYLKPSNLLSCNPQLFQYQ